MRTHQFGLFVALGLGIATLAASQAAAQQDRRFDGVTLRIGTWGGTNRDALKEHAAIELEKRGARVEFVIGSPQDNFAKIVAARGRDVPMDAFEILGSLLPEVAGRNLLAPLNHANIPNEQYIDKSQIAPTVVATWTTQEMIFYNTEKFQELNLQPPKSLRELTNPAFAGRVMIPDISSGGGLEGVGAFALTAGGDETNIEPGLRLIREIPGVKFWKAGVDVITQFKSGDILVAVAHAGWAVRTAYAGVPIRTIPAQIGAHTGMIKEGWIGVVRGSKVQEAAEFYINTMLSTEVQYQMSVKTGTVAVNREALKRLGDVPVVKDLVILDPERIKKMTKLDPTKINLSQWNDQWNRMIVR